MLMAIYVRGKTILEIRSIFETELSDFSAVLIARDTHLRSIIVVARTWCPARSERFYFGHKKSGFGPKITFLLLVGPRILSMARL